MGELVDKLALRLLELGIGAREFVSCQFPNRWEFAIAHLATIRIGAISSAIMPIYGKREVRFMLERTGSRVCIALERTPKSEPGKMLDRKSVAEGRSVQVGVDLVGRRIIKK